MNLSDYKNEDAIELLADIIEPASVIFQDKDLQFVSKQGNTFKLVRLAMKKHSKEIMEVLARVDGVNVEEYSITAPQILIKLTKLMSDKDMMSFFGLQESEKNGSSGYATENTEEKEI